MDADKTMTGTEDLVAFIDRVFGSDSFGLFCGAGISLDSGIPLASHLQKEILSEILLTQIPKHCSWASHAHPLGDDYAKSEKRVTDILKSRIPFEVIMEAALGSGHDGILEVFDCKFPNINHISIANLARRGVLKTIYTTNFDTLIEQALRHGKEKVKDDNFFVLHTPEEMNSWKGIDLQNNMTGIIKLHGCISDIPSLKTTISKVAEKRLADSMRPALEKLLKTGLHKSVIFMGYSFSDSFDINPAFKYIVNSDKQLILINHAKDECDIQHFSQVTMPDLPDFLSNFNGWRIKCNTSTFLKVLANHYGVSSTEPYGNNGFDWTIYVKKWGNEISEHNNLHNYTIMGHIFAQMGNHQDAIRFYKRAAWISSQTQDKAGESYINSLISGSYQYLKNRQMQNQHSRKAIDLSEKGSLNDFNALLAHGRVCYERKNFVGAKNIFEYMLHHPEFTADEFKGAVYIGLAIANHGLGRFKESIEFSQKSLKISQEYGNLMNQCSSYMNLGRAYADMNDYKASLDAHHSALLIAKSLKDKQVIRHIEKNINIIQIMRRLFNFKTKLNSILKRT